ncbi:MAG TPA: hypothetical protein VHG35_06685 [Gemmatimonadales bacterium]|nr:hypothetical protein [Gemmatimonadales bacterium]
MPRHRRHAAGCGEPIAVAEATLQCRVAGTAGDALLPSLIKAARKAYEGRRRVARDAHPQARH